MDIIFRTKLNFKEQYLFSALVSFLGTIGLFVFKLINLYLFIPIISITLIITYFLWRNNYYYTLTKDYLQKNNIFGQKIIYPLKDIEKSILKEKEIEKNIKLFLYLKIINIKNDVIIHCIDNKNLIIIYCNLKELGVFSEIIKLDNDINEFADDGGFENEYDCKKILN